MTVRVSALALSGMPYVHQAHRAVPDRPPIDHVTGNPSRSLLGARRNRRRDFSAPGEGHHRCREVADALEVLDRVPEVVAAEVGEFVTEGAGREVQR
ncbi:MAG TPA: hypothetical protein VGD12_05560 [Blastococcus sp.]|jgi:hypothetical protein